MVMDAEFLFCKFLILVFYAMVILFHSFVYVNELHPAPKFNREERIWKGIEIIKFASCSRVSVKKENKWREMQISQAFLQKILLQKWMQRKA